MGYTDLFAPVLRLIDDCMAEAPSLIPPLKKALEKCWRAENGGEYGERCIALRSLRSREAKEAGCRALGYPPPGLGKEEALNYIQVLRSLADEPGLKEEAGRVINQLENVAGSP